MITPPQKLESLSAKIGRTALAITRAILANTWLYFPSLLFLLVVKAAFWNNTDGQDIMTAFAEANRNTFRFFFFLATGFWIYMTWFSSRIIGEIKDRQPGSLDNPVTELIRNKYPRIAGYAGFLLVELAILQLPALGNGHAPWTFILLLGLALFIWLDHIVGDRVADSTTGYWIERRFWIIFITYFAIIYLFARFINLSTQDYLWTMFGGVLTLHIIFLFYVNLRRRVVGDARNVHLLSKAEATGFHERLLAFFCINPREKSYLIWLVWTSIVCLVVTVTASFNPRLAVFLGPLTILLLSFSFLLAAGNLIAAFSVKYRISFHVILIILAFALSNTVQRHRVQLLPAPNGDNGYAARPKLATYLKSWLRRVPAHGYYDTYFILADGGASRSGFWTASILGEMEDTFSTFNPADSFRGHVFSLSGTSGGGVGVATFFSLLSHSTAAGRSPLRRSADSALRQDYFSFTAARLLGWDYFYYLFPFNFTFDRAAALAKSFEAYHPTGGLVDPGYGDGFSIFHAMDDGGNVLLPILFINTTRMQDGRPGIVTNLKPEDSIFGKRLDVLDSLDRSTDISLATAALLGARFPYVSPAGNIGNNYFVDGGYFDNSGSGVTQELIRGILRIYLENRQDSIYGRIANLRLHVLHIANSPVISTDAQKPVSNIQNDLAAPIITLLGAYDMQTTVNDTRLQDLISDVNSFAPINGDYHRISLYIDPEETPTDIHPQLYGGTEVYAMNWFMSDTTHQRITRRLDSQPALNKIIRGWAMDRAKLP